MSPDEDPLVGPVPGEIPLPEAPLVRVIAQVRFSPILSIRDPGFTARFQEAIRSDYPVLRSEDTQGLAVAPHGVVPGPKETTWRFCELDGPWRVSLAPEFLALETTAYTRRSDLLERLKVVVGALQDHVQPALVQRLGLRYIDRVEGEALEHIDELVRHQMLGIMATSLACHVQHSVGEALLGLPETNEFLRMRWGRIPPRATVDPNAIEPIDAPSWILDLDMFSVQEQALSAESIVHAARCYAERLYSVFRWAVTDKFLLRYGGKF